jgi:glyoxylase-like metal-dependent hydrolase (beta-lactamase superfamily II)
LNVIPIHAANPGPFTGDGNWTYLIPGERPVVIDAGVGNSQHLDALAAAAPDGPAAVIVTHAHSDHAAGVPAIQRRWPAARFFKYPWPERDARYDVPWERLDDGAQVATGEGPLLAVHTPGHSPDHLSFWHAGSRTIFAGDLLIAGGTVFIPASSGGNLAAYLDSLARVAALEPARALPAHGPVIEEPVTLITHYLEHRRQREEQVIAALASGAHTIETITDRIYAGYASAVIPAARESVLAHLNKLGHEQRVNRDGDRWTLNREGK